MAASKATEEKVRYYESAERKALILIDELNTCYSNVELRYKVEELKRHEQEVFKAHAELIQFIFDSRLREHNFVYDALCTRIQSSLIKSETRIIETADAVSMASMGSSISSVIERKLKLSESQAALKVELEFSEEEQRLNAALKQLQLKKKMAISKAQLDSIHNLEDEFVTVDNIGQADSFPSKLPSRSRDRIADLEKFLDEHEVKTEAVNIGAFTSTPTPYQAITPPYTHRNQPTSAPMQQEVSNIPMTKEPGNVSDETVEKLVNSFRLPPIKVDRFDGNPLTFPTWETSFDSLLASKAASTAEKLNLLSQYLVGEPKLLINNYLLLQSDNAYDIARKELKDRYGNGSVIANAFLTKLSSWPKVSPRDNIGLRKFSDFVCEMATARMKVPDLGILDYPQENYKMVCKLPYNIENKWRAIVQKNLSVNKSFPTVMEFSEFLKTKAKEANIPMFQSSYNSSVSSEITTKSIKKSSSSFVTNVNDQSSNFQKKCRYCKNVDHDVDSCESFLKLHLNDRKKFLFDARLCYGCGKANHIKQDCRNKSRCKKCSKQHLTCLHYDQPVKNIVDNKCTIVCGSNDCSNDNSMIVPVWVRNVRNSSEYLVYGILDPQSNSCFMTDDLISKLGIAGTPTQLKLSTIHTSGCIVDCRKVDGLEMISFDRREVVTLPPLFSRQHIPVERSQIPTPEVARKWEHLQSISNFIIPYMPDVPVSLLIGNNVPSVVRPRDIKAGADDQPYGQKSLMGWGIVGTVCKNVQNVVCHRNLVLSSSSKEIITPHQINQMFEIDFADHKVKPESMEERRFLKIMDENIKQLHNGHYEMPLPLKSNEIVLPDNRQLAEKRLNKLKRRFSYQPQYKDDYIEFMDQIIKQYAEKVPNDLLGVKVNVNYVPHTGVYHSKKPQQIRVVFDCSAQYKGVSVNDCLLPGPNLLNHLLGVLLRFRLEKVALMADIQSMFHQFYVSEDSRDLLRFLWWKDNNPNNEVQEYRMKVHLFGAVSSPACANYGLRRAADDGEKEFGKAAADFIRDNFYVDDGLISVASSHEAITLIRNSSAICAKAGLRLHKWISNDRDVLKGIPKDERGKLVKDIDLKYDTLPIERALGVSWCVESDSFKFRITLNDNPPTRRNILGTISSIYDPFGFAAPVLIIGKLILQAMCKQNLDWDEPLTDDLRSRWKQWCEDIVHLTKLQIPRCYKPNGFGKVKSAEIHYFSDASEKAYGQCTYLRLVNDNDDCSVSFLVGKARVTPAKRAITIPRLELTAAVLSARTSKFIKEELPYDVKEYFWTDSMVVLGYLQNESKRYQVYVANRVQQINDTTSVKDWNYVESSSNPSDVASRGIRAQQLITGSRWVSGPEFLHEPGLTKPAHTEEIDEDTSKIVALELKRIQSFNINVDKVFQNEDPLKHICSRFSNWMLLKKVVAQLLIFKKKLMLAANVTIKKGGIIERISGNCDLTVQDIQVSESVILNSIQSEHFPVEKSILQNIGMNIKNPDEVKQMNRNLKKTSSIRRLDPYLDEFGIIRVGGRIRNATVPKDVRHPVIIPRKSHITNLIVEYHHKRVHHMGRSTTLNCIRQSGYWIIGGSSAVSLYIHKCVTCRKLRGALSIQKMADLPIDRLEQHPPFTYCAVDIFGPFLIKDRRSKVKRYGVLYTCLASRAVHLESVNSLETDSFINSLRRFISIRGPVRQIRSDQGTNFVGARNEFAEAKIKQYLLSENCDWISFKFNVPSASHMGGIWERMIRTVRSALEPILHRCGDQLDDESFRTLLSEVQNIVNSRPLTVNTLSEADSPEPLTPNHLLTMKAKVILPPPGVFQDADVYCRRRWRRVQYCADQFWQRWKKEYLASLQTRQKWTHQQRNMEIGDVVLIKDDNAPRNQWKLGTIIDVYSGDDGLVRKVQLRTGKQKTLERPVHKLILLLAK